VSLSRTKGKARKRAHPTRKPESWQGKAGNVAPGRRRSGETPALSPPRASSEEKPAKLVNLRSNRRQAARQRCLLSAIS